MTTGPFEAYRPRNLLFVPRLLLILSLALLTTSCGKEQEEQTPEPGQFNRETLAWDLYPKRVGELLTASVEATVPTQVEVEGAGELPARFPPPETLELPEIEELPWETQLPEPLGTRLLSLPESAQSLAISNDGTVYAGLKDRVIRIMEPGVSEEFAPIVARQLLFDETGRRLLVRSLNVVYVFSGQELEKEESLPSEIPQGKVFWGTRSGTLLFVNEYIVWDASAERRIALRVQEYDLETAEVRPVDWSALQFAALGTLAPTGMVWGHRVQPYQIDPMPAPLLLVEKGSIVNFLTETANAADVSPSADANRNLYWVRTWRRGGKTGRGFTTDLTKDIYEEKQLTGRPTSGLSIAPSGRFGVFIVQTADQSFEYRRFAREDLEQSGQKLAAFAQVDSDFRENALAVLKAVREAFAKTPAGESQIKGKFGPELEKAPDLEEIEVARKALVDGLGKEFGITFRGGVSDLVVLDALMEHAVPFWPEEPAMVAALAGTFAKSDVTEPAWIEETIRPNLSYELSDLSVGDGISYTAVSPFIIARNALTKGLSFAETARELAREWDEPYYFVENYSTKTIQAIQERELRRAGLEGERFLLEDLLSALQESGNATLGLVAYSVAREQGDLQAAAWAAWRLSMLQPANSAALRMLADVLLDASYFQLAETVYDQAVLLAPEDPYLRLKWAQALLFLGKFEQARDQLELVTILDRQGIYTDIVNERQELIKEFEEEENAP